jgi:hypothetical protein
MTAGPTRGKPVPAGGRAVIGAFGVKTSGEPLFTPEQP